MSYCSFCIHHMQMSQAMKHPSNQRLVSNSILESKVTSFDHEFTLNDRLNEPDILWCGFISHSNRMSFSSLISSQRLQIMLGPFYLAMYTKCCKTTAFTIFALYQMTSDDIQAIMLKLSCKFLVVNHYHQHCQLIPEQILCLLYRSLDIQSRLCPRYSSASDQ